MANEIEEFWKPSFETLYDACYYELASEYVITRWSRVHLITSTLAAITATGSAVSGWALWSNPNGRVLWSCIAAPATVLSIVHGTLGVPGRIKEEEQRRQQFSGLRVDLETFRHRLTIGCEFMDANNTFGQLRERLSTYVSKTPPDILLTKAARKLVQSQVNEKLQTYINA